MSIASLFLSLITCFITSVYYLPCLVAIVFMTSSYLLCIHLIVISLPDLILATDCCNPSPTVYIYHLIVDSNPYNDANPSTYSPHCQYFVDTFVTF